MSDHDPQWLDECRERALGFSARFTSRIGEGEQQLVSAACPKGCSPCFRECAVRYIIANQWSRDWAGAEAAAASTQQRSGSFYSHLSGRA